MKMNHRLILASLLALGLLAQSAAAQPAPASTNAPAKAGGPAEKQEKKKAGKKKAAPKKKDPAAELRSVPLVAGPAVVIASNVNVRGQAKLNSEIVTRLQKGQSVKVLEEVTLKNSGPTEPSAWAKIVLPPTAHAWVNTAFINASNHTVLPKKLNLRSGAGENYSIIGVLKHGDTVKELGTKAEWTQIEPPADAYAFMAAQYLKQEPGGVAPTAPSIPPPVAETTPPPIPTAVPGTPPVAAATEPTVPPADPTLPPPPALEPTNSETAAIGTGTNAVPEEPLPPRIVQREGIVRGTLNVQTPSRFELISPDNGRVINYLYTTSRELDLGRYKGLHIIVTGEEGLDERWRNTPVITIQKIQVLD